jgi:hypothetical protein
MAPPTLEELVYSAAQRALDQQSTALSDLRTRTSTLIAAATLSASFLGAAAIGHGAPAWATILAMAAFLLTGALAGWVLWRHRFHLWWMPIAWRRNLPHIGRTRRPTFCGPGMVCATYLARIKKSLSGGSAFSVSR